jgi:hypothetical protein
MRPLASRAGLSRGEACASTGRCTTALPKVREANEFGAHNARRAGIKTSDLCMLKVRTHRGLGFQTPFDRVRSLNSRGMNSNLHYSCPKIVDGKRCGGPSILWHDPPGPPIFQCVGCAHMFEARKRPLRHGERARLRGHRGEAPGITIARG